MKSIRIEANAMLDGEMLTTSIECSKLKFYIEENDIPCLINHKPTNYLCNYAYHKVLKRNKKVIFVHLPELKNIKNLDKLINLMSNINSTICI